MNKPESSEMVLVPREPTQAMLAAADKLIDCDPTWIARAYRAMLCEAPAAHPSNQVQEPMFYAFKHNRGNGKIGWTFHTPDEYSTAYRDTCLEVVPLVAASPQAVPSEQPIAEQPNSSKANLTSRPTKDLPPALPGNTRRLVTRARRIFRVLEGNETVPTERVMGLLSEMADVLQYGDCSYWCPACYAEVSAPQHPAISMSMFASRADFDAALREASAGEVPSDKKYLPPTPPPAASLPVSAPAGVRMLTNGELESCLGRFFNPSHAESVQRRFIKANGLKLAAMSATTEPKP